MLRFVKTGKLALGLVAALGVSVVLDPFISSLWNTQESSQAVAQDRQGRNRNWGNRGGQGNRGFGGFSPDDMTQAMFDRIKNSDRADFVKRMYGDEKWAQWERGEFSKTDAASDAAQAQAKQDGELKEIANELTEEEKRDAEARLRSGTVPEFVPEGAPRYSVETEADYYRQAMARRDDVLVDAAPLTLRYYVRHLMNKYDANGDGILQRAEWENKIEGAQAIDLDGDFDLTDQEILFFLTRFAKDRTIFNPNPARVKNQRVNFVTEEAEQEVLIRPASAAPKKLSDAEAREARFRNDGETSLADMTDEEVRGVFVEGNPALESVDDEEMLDALLSDMDESSVREYAAPPQQLIGAPVWFLARDKNGDGQLTLLEFAPQLSPRLLALFGQYDADGDQIITAEEARRGPVRK